MSLLVVGAGACEKSAQLRAAVEADRLGWKQRSSALKGRASNLDDRLKALPPEPAGTSPASVARRRRVEALITGSRQSSFDLDQNIDDSLRGVEAAIGRGDKEGEQALATAAETIDGYFRQQEQSVAAAEAALLQIGEGH
jgi:hypothetical protein